MKTIKKWGHGHFFSSRILFVFLIVFTLFEAAEVITADKKQLIFEVALKDKNPQIDKKSPNATVVHEYKFQLDSSNWFYNFVLENNIGPSPLNSLTFLIICYCGLLVTLNLNPSDFFGKDVSRPISIAALSLILFYFIERYTYRSFRSTVLETTNNEYMLVQLENSWMLWSGIGLAWIGKMMKRGYQLQKDQDLTI